MNPLNTRFNKAGWSAAANALIMLINGRLPIETQLSATEQGLIMTIITFAVVMLVPNAEAAKPK